MERSYPKKSAPLRTLHSQILTPPPSVSAESAGGGVPVEFSPAPTGYEPLPQSSRGEAPPIIFPSFSIDPRRLYGRCSSATAFFFAASPRRSYRALV